MAEAADFARDEEAASKAIQATNLVLKKRDLARAVTLFEEALAVPAQQPFAYVNALYAVNLAAEKKVRIEPVRIRRLLGVCFAQSGLHGDGHLNAALCFMRLGDKEEALVNLQKAKRKGVKLAAHLSDRAFAALATDKRFLALVKSSG